MLIVLMAVSIAVTFFIISQQNKTASYEALKRSINIIRSDLLGKEAKLLSDTVQLANLNEMGSRIKSLANSKGNEGMALILANSVQTMTTAIFQLGMASGLWQTAIYDSQGNIVSFVVEQADQTYALGYALTGGKTSIRSACLKPGDEKPAIDAWKETENIAGSYLKLKFGEDIPKENTVFFKVIEGNICLESYAPVMGKQLSKEGELEQIQVGFALAVLKIDENFVKKMSYLTGSRVNLFSGDSLSSGDLPEYNKLRADLAKGSKGKWDLAKQEISLSDLDIGKDGYSQGVLQLCGSSGPIGSVAALCSQTVAKANTWQIVRLLLMIYAGCLLVVVPLAISFANALARPIIAAIKSLTSATDEVSSTSFELFGSAQRLADAASGQAASVEETCASLEEMASMTRQNAENASQANQLMTEAKRVVEQANNAMGVLTSSIGEISRASEETQKIIRTIDEIAFQTNLLALNAAVEAARAGEAGAGFAVVADEVRNLAVRAADAAKSTANLIEGTVKTVKEGSDLVTKTNGEFLRVAAIVTKSGELVTEISAASYEQAHGVEQINKVVSEIDAVTQQNSSSAEQSASSLEEMSAQAKLMRESVVSLESLIGGSGKGNAKMKSPIYTGKTQAQPAVPVPVSIAALSRSEGSGKVNFVESAITKRGR